MSLERMFAAIESLRETASADAVLGESQEIQGKILIPVATVGRGFRTGFSKGALGESDYEEQPAESKGYAAAGGAGSRPIAVIEVTPEETLIRPIVDETRVALAGIALGAWIVFWVASTVRSVFGSRP
jgi:uncharacterized spore protein YtfJ